MAKKPETWAEINARTTALNKKLGTKPYVQPPKPAPAKPLVTKTPPVKPTGVVDRVRGAFNGLRNDVQTTRRQNIDDIVDGKKRRKP